MANTYLKYLLCIISLFSVDIPGTMYSQKHETEHIYIIIHIVITGFWYGEF